MESRMTRLYVHVCLLAILVRSGMGHGIMLEPPSRASMWRVGFKTPHDYDDNGRNCGGFNHQHSNEGKCGICGDPWDATPREHEAGGKFANGIITRQYTTNSMITATIVVTMSHEGYFEFRICPHNSPSTPATQECLDKYLLQQPNGDTKFYFSKIEETYMYGRFKAYNVTLKLPKDLRCNQCVIQWRWHTGNNWGICSDGVTGRLGCGIQEEFYSCADIGISESIATNPVTTSAPVTTSSASLAQTSPALTPRTTSTTSPGGRPTKKCISSDAYKSVAYDVWCMNIYKAGSCPKGYCVFNDNAPQPGSNCTPTETYKNIPTMSKWCVQNCALGYCPPSHCKCS